MKIKLAFKTPDTVDDSVNYALENATEEEKDVIKKIIGRWVEYGECVTIEIDTETGTAQVLSL